MPESPGLCLARENPAPVLPDSDSVRAAILIDLSVSMAGFLGDRNVPMPVTPLQELLRTGLSENLGRVGVREISWQGFGRGPVELPAVLSGYDPRRAGAARSLFNEPETNCPFRRIRPPIPLEGGQLSERSDARGSVLMKVAAMGR